MSKLSDLRTKRDKLAADAEAINAKYPNGTRMPTTEAEKLDALLYQIAGVDGEIRGLLDSAPDVEAEGSAPARILRTAKEIRAHYRIHGAPASAMGFDDFLRGIAGMKTTPEVHAALSEGTDTAGGYAVPKILMPRILEALVPASSLLQAGAGIVPMNGAKDVTTAGIDTIPTAAWRLESGNVATSDLTFRAVVAAPKSLAFMFKVSRELLQDAANMQEALITACSQAMAKELDRAGLRGSGTNPEPRGIKNTTGINTVTNGANGTALATYANFVSALQANAEADAPAPTAAIMSPRSMMQLAGLVDSTGQPLAKPEIMKDLRFIMSTQVPNNITTGTSNDTSEIYVGNFSQMAFIMREQFSIAMLKELYAGTGEIGFVCHVRADVAIWYAKAFTLVSGVRP